MTKYAFITLVGLICACIAIYTIWTLRVSRNRPDDLLTEFKKTDRSLSDTNDSLENNITGTGAFKRDSFHLPEVELAIKANSITATIDSIKHELVILTKKDTVASFSYPDKNRILALKNNLLAYNSFIQKKFSHKQNIEPPDLIDVDDIQTGTGPTRWEIYYFENSTVFAIITELTFINTQVQKLRYKAIR